MKNLKYRIPDIPKSLASRIIDTDVSTMHEIGILATYLDGREGSTKLSESLFDISEDLKRVGNYYECIIDYDYFKL